MYRALLAALCLVASVPAADTRAPLPEAQLASAVKAAVASPQAPEIRDHYGDPDNFIKYIIRKPPTFA